MILTSKHFKVFIAIILTIAALATILSIFGDSKNVSAEEQYDFAPNFIAIGNSNNSCRYYYDADTNVVYIAMSKSKYVNGLSPVYKADGTLLTLEELITSNSH